MSGRAQRYDRGATGLAFALRMSAKTDTRAAAEAAVRQSYGRLVAYLAARSRDVAGAEDALAEAFAAALEQWPRTGVPANPDAWLLSVARRRQIDAGRRQQTAAGAREHLAMIDDERNQAGSNEDVPDERLRLMFTCAHPAIDPMVRAPLMLQTVLGFDAASIAAAFLVPAATMGQRLVRAKGRIKEAGIPFRVPERADLPDRLDAVLSAIYAAFTAGWAQTDAAGDRRQGLAGEAIWLGRLMTSLMPREPETLGLLALMLYADARSAARRDAEGNYIPLSDQQTDLWNTTLINEAETLLREASSFGETGRYQLEAAVQSAHCARRHTGATDWAAIKKLYDVLALLSPSPVVALNRAVAIAETDGPIAGLAALDAIATDKRLETYQPYWAARADLLARLDRAGDAIEAYDRAIWLESDAAVRMFLKDRQSRIARQLH